MSLIDEHIKIKVSSTLDKSVGKKYLTDGSSETCWTSQQGLPQYVQLTFGAAAVPKTISLTFQGGFVGSQCEVLISTVSSTPSTSDWTILDHIYPDDVNRAQVFQLKPVEGGVHHMKLVFHQSTDFYGRITIYDLQVLGDFV